MKCPLCGYEKPHKHGKTSKGAERYFCPKCRQTLAETFDPLYYRRQVSSEDVRIVLQSHEGSSLRGISRISGLAYDTVVSIVQAAAQKAQMVHTASVYNVDTDAIAADELWSFVEKNTSSLPARGTRDWGCTDSIEFGSTKRVDSLRSCRQAYRQTGYRVSD
jgi:transposase-like protein